MKEKKSFNIFRFSLFEHITKDLIKFIYYIKFRKKLMRLMNFAYFSLVILAAVFCQVLPMISYNTTDLLDPVILRPFMFTEEIFGNLTVFEPKNQQM